MSCCCKNIYKFCKPVNACDPGEFNSFLTGMGDGNYVLELSFLEQLQHIPFTKAASVITFATPIKWNEDYRYQARILSTANEPIPFIVATVPYDCFEFETKIFVA